MLPYSERSHLIDAKYFLSSRRVTILLSTFAERVSPYDWCIHLECFFSTTMYSKISLLELVVWCNRQSTPPLSWSKTQSFYQHVSVIVHIETCRPVWAHVCTIGLLVAARSTRNSPCWYRAHSLATVQILHTYMCQVNKNIIRQVNVLRVNPFFTRAVV